jgi:hypothetical protein
MFSNNVSLRNKAGIIEKLALGALAAAALTGTVWAQEVAPLDEQTVLAQAAAAKNFTQFDLRPNAKFLSCVRASASVSPKATVRVFRGLQNDTLLLDLTGFKPGLGFDLFTVQSSPFLSNGQPDPSFKDFGMAWYQSDVEVQSNHTAHVQIKTILLDQIFGFDPRVGLSPTNTFHVGFWFDNPKDAAACGFDVTKPTPFNGEHKAGPVAFISAPVSATKLGPLCVNPNKSTQPISCNP